MISIIIISYNKKDLTKKCLESISKNTSQALLKEIIVIDNASEDGSIEFLKKQKNIQLILSKSNLGFSKANNLASKKAVGDLLVFLNNDTEVQPGWLESILNIYKTEKNVGAVGVKLLYPDGLVQHAGVTIAIDHTPRHIYRGDKADKPYVNKQREFKAVTAACIAIPKKIFEKFGGFDEGFVNGMEDVDLCLKIYNEGYRIIYCPKSVVIHHESVAPGRFDKNRHNADLYMSRWRDVESDEHKYYKKDGFNALQIFIKDMMNLAYADNEYHTIPKYIRCLRYVYIPIQKFTLICKLIVTLDFKTLGQKIRKVV